MEQVTRHPFDNRTLYRLMWDGDVVAEGYGYDESAFDSLIAWANKQMPLGIVRTGGRTAVSAGGEAVTLEVVC
jgi:hypothetical protein